MSVVDIIRNELGRGLEQVKAFIRKGWIATITDSYFAQLKATDDEHYNDVELWQQFGFTSLPPSGSEALIVSAGGEGGNAAIIATQSRTNRPTIETGEAALYAQASGSNQVIAKAKVGGDLDLDPGSGTVNVGGDSTDCADYLLKGSAFATAHNNMLSYLSAALTNLGSDPALSAGTKTACNTAASAISTFTGLNHLATKGKVK